MPQQRSNKQRRRADNGRMTGGATIVGGIIIPSTDPVFDNVTVGVHIPLGIACIITDAGLCSVGSAQRAPIRI
jgi:hypothetical protein